MIKTSEYIPTFISCMKEKYGKEDFLGDLFAGVSVGIISLPLVLAYAIGSGVAPERGLFTAIVAGFLISLLGGSRVQIGGPTGAYIVIVYSIVQKHGYDGLATATLLAGAMIVLMGVARFGILLKYIPYPVTTGFTTGIAFSIVIAQIKDFFGLLTGPLPPHCLQKCQALWQYADTFNAWTIVLSATSLAAIFAFRRFFPKLPGTIIVIAIAATVAALFQLPVETIETKFGSLPRVLPSPSLPDLSYSMLVKVFPDACAIAMLGAIESLLSAVVADGLTGFRHRSNGELVAQGIANTCSVLFGGIPATGAIARTAMNVKMGAKTPIAGMIHAVTLLFLMLLFSPLAMKIPLSVLSAVLLFVAWNMSELPHFAEILRSNLSDAAILLTTFLLTVFIDLNAALQGGVLLSALLFLKKMSDKTEVKECGEELPEGVASFEITGPLFYAVAEQLTLIQLPKKAVILRMHSVTIVDATGEKALKDFQKMCEKKNILFLISGLKVEGVEKYIPKEHLFTSMEQALSALK